MTMIATKCFHCKENEVRPGDKFCSQICFMLWYETTRMRLMEMVLNDILDQDLTERVLEDANARHRQP